MTEAKKHGILSFCYPNQHGHPCEFGDIITISPNHIEVEESYGGNTLHLMPGDMSNMNMIDRKLDNG